MDAQYLRERAAHYRRLARDIIDDQTRAVLLKLAVECDQAADASEQCPARWTNEPARRAV